MTFARFKENGSWYFPIDSQVGRILIEAVVADVHAGVVRFDHWRYRRIKKDSESLTEKTFLLIFRLSLAYFNYSIANSYGFYSLAIKMHYFYFSPFVKKHDNSRYVNEVLKKILLAFGWLAHPPGSWHSKLFPLQLESLNWIGRPV